jgi:mercuric ion binding protein
MKRFLFLFTFLLSATAFADGRTVTATVKGMVCGFCAQGIAKKFGQESAVAKLDVSLDKKRVTIDLKDGQDLPDEKIKSILEDSGYSVEKIERTGR